MLELSRRRLLWIAAGAACRPASAFGTPDKQLAAEGPHLLDARLRLRGVAVGDPLLARPDRPSRDYEIIRHGWSANTVRLSVHPSMWRHARAAMREALRSNVDAALEHGLYVIIVWHAIGWPDDEYFVPQGEWRLPGDAFDTDLDLAYSFWSEIASSYGGEPRILFELWNEPVLLAESAQAIQPGADWARLRPIWMALTAFIRRKSPNLILATGGRWAADLTGVREDPLPDPDTGYAWHVYPSTGEGSMDRIALLLDGLHETRPVVVTEWGFGKAGEPSAAEIEFGAAFAERFLLKYQLHWTAWCWHPHWSPSLLRENWRSPTTYGQFVKELLAR